MITSEHFPVLDFWFNTVGVNVCAANTSDKRVSDRWKIRQTEPITTEEYEQLKKDGEFVRLSSPDHPVGNSMMKEIM